MTSTFRIDHHPKGTYHLPLGICVYCGQEVSPDFAIPVDDKFTVCCLDCLEQEVTEIEPNPRGITQD